MRVLIVHNSYQLPGGEDSVVENERALLSDHDWETRLWSVSNDAISGTWSKMTAALRASYSRPARDQLASIIREFAPEIVHVHNFFPLLSPSVYDACQNAGIAVVQTLHNYRAICAGAILTRDNRPCEDCITGSPYQGALHGCYRGSRLGSLAVARMIDTHRRRGTWSHKVDRLIALSAFAKSKFLEAGFPPDRLVVKPNFVPDRPITAGERKGALFVGRLSSEKGVPRLMRAFDGLDVPLRLIGDGPLHALIEKATSQNVTALGWKTPAEVAAEMARAAFLVVPSESPENFPMVIVEAYAQGLPVLASHLPALAEIVEDGVTGLLFNRSDADDISAKALWAYQHPDEMRTMGDRSRRAYEKKYSASVNFAQLASIYEAAVEQRRSAV